jgi:glycosyltransferase involved in cell wall biosynthesis
VARARNVGLERASSRWVAFVDDDDLWAPDKLAAQLAAMQTDDEARWACVGCVIVDEDLEVVRASFTPRERDVADHLLSFNHIPGGGSGVVAERSLVEDAGGFDVELGTLADWDLWIRLGLRSPLASVDRPLMAYLEHGGGMSRGARDIRGELEVIRRRYDRERAARGRTFDLSWWLRWFGELDERSGRRGSALRHHAERLKLGDRSALRDLGRALRGPAAWRAIDRRDLEAVPPAWRDEAEAWLGPLRSA